MDKSFLVLFFKKELLPFFAGWYLRFALRTTRWSLVGAEHLEPYLREGAVIVAVWHERLAIIPALWSRARRTYPDRRVVALASRHRDGQFVAGVLARFGVRVVHGSSADSKRRERGGAAGLRGLLAALSAGDAVVITPDGPRGPRRVAAPGAAQLATLSGAPVLAVAGQVRWRIVLRSWDRMVVPLPFGRGTLVCLQVAGDVGPALDMAAERADELCK